MIAIPMFRTEEVNRGTGIYGQQPVVQEGSMCFNHTTNNLMIMHRGKWVIVSDLDLECPNNDIDLITCYESNKIFDRFKKQGFLERRSYDNYRHHMRAIERYDKWCENYKFPIISIEEYTYYYTDLYINLMYRERNFKDIIKANFYKLNHIIDFRMLYDYMYKMTVNNNDMCDVIRLVLKITRDWNSYK